jgi:hypothetical protein
VEAAGVGLRVVSGVLGVIGIGLLTVTLLRLRGRVLGAPFVREAAIGTTSAGVVFAVQSGSVGTSFGGAIVALATGAITVLLVAFFRSV